MKTREFKLDWVLILLIVLTCIGITSASATNIDLVSKGKQYISENKFEMARQCFSLAIKSDPNDVPAYLERSKVWVLLGECENSMNDLLQAVSINSEAVEDYLEQSDLDEADLRPCFRSFR